MAAWDQVCITTTETVSHHDANDCTAATMITPGISENHDMLALAGHNYTAFSHYYHRKEPKVCKGHQHSFTKASGVCTLLHCIRRNRAHARFACCKEGVGGFSPAGHVFWNPIGNGVAYT